MSAQHAALPSHRPLQAKRALKCADKQSISCVDEGTYAKRFLFFMENLIVSDANALARPTLHAAQVRKGARTAWWRVCVRVCVCVRARARVCVYLSHVSFALLAHPFGPLGT